MYLNKDLLSLDWHDHQLTAITLPWLLARAESLFIHCKNIEALTILLPDESLTSFWHQEDKYTLTSKRQIWCYPGETVPPGGIQCSPDLKEALGVLCSASGVCSDYVAKLRYE